MKKMKKERLRWRIDGGGLRAPPPCLSWEVMELPVFHFLV